MIDEVIRHTCHGCGQGRQTTLATVDKLLAAKNLRRAPLVERVAYDAVELGRAFPYGLHVGECEGARRLSERQQRESQWGGPYSLVEKCGAMWTLAVYVEQVPEVSPVVRTMVDVASTGEFKPGGMYVRWSLLAPEVAPDDHGFRLVEAPFNLFDVTCCGARVSVTWGLGAPCGGFSTWACCMGEHGCGRCAWFIPDVEDEDDLAARRPSPPVCTVCGWSETKHASGGGGEPHAFDPVGGLNGAPQQPLLPSEDGS